MHQLPPFLDLPRFLGILASYNLLLPMMRLSSIRLRQVIFQTITFLLWGQQVAETTLAREGVWTFLYLDQDFRILKARPVAKEATNIYVLSRA